MSDAVLMARQSYQQAPRWIQMLLIASLGINLLFIGLAAGALWRFRGPPVAIGITPNLLGYASSLAPDRRKMLWDVTDSERQHLRPFRREVRLAREETLKILMEEPFDRAKFLKAQERQEEAERRARVAVQALYAKIAASMTYEERHAFQAWREARRPPSQNLLDEPDHPKGVPAQVK
jgi:uncharacterized membrane protein